LDYLFGQNWRPLNVGLLLHLHRNLFEQTKMDDGRFKDNDNLVVDRSPDRSVEVRFVPVSAASTECFTSAGSSRSSSSSPNRPSATTRLSWPPPMLGARL
jgi:hypothetical protein